MIILIKYKIVFKIKVIKIHAYSIIKLFITFHTYYYNVLTNVYIMFLFSIK